MKSRYNKKINADGGLVKEISNHELLRYDKTPKWTHLIVTVAICSMLCAGCKKFVQIPAPTSQLVTSSVFSDASLATAAQTGIYSQMINSLNPYYVDYYLGLSSDELTNFATIPQSIQFYTNSLNAINSNSEAIWDNAYNYIYQANAVIGGLQNNNSIAPAIKKQLTGEAEFTRSFWYFYLVNLFGDVPLITTTNYSSNAVFPRTPQSQVYQQMITDLKSAQSLLNSNYVDISDTTVTTDKVRPNKGAATALLARIYLYQGDWADAATQASAVIDNSLYSLSPLNQVFLANSSEAIWQLMPTVNANYGNTPEGDDFILTGAPLSSVWNSSELSSYLLNSFEPGDARKSAWIDSVTANGTTYYFPYKYKVYYSSIVTEYSMVLRLAEQYLIRAEAEANGAGSGPGAAVADLNTIRTRAGLPPLPGSLAQSITQLLAAVAQERRVELFTEWGDRWLNLRRTATINAVLGSPGNICSKKGGTWNPDHALFPIPQTDRAGDHNLTQNPGY